MQEIQEDVDLELSVVATGMHLSPTFGMTVDAIEGDGFPIDKCIEILLASDSDTAIVKSMGVALISFADALKTIEPDIIVVLGDRFEIVPVALAAIVLHIPIAHIHGGETSQGAIDEAFRHAVTKMATMHFPVTERYRKRILQMGEAPELTFNFGAPGLDAIYRLPLPDRKQLAAALQFDLDGVVAVITYHPVTTEQGTALEQVDSLLAALERSDIKGIITKANADSGGSLINQRMAAFCRKHPDRFKMVDSLGQRQYLSCLKHLDLMIGNSSSGLIEAPSFSLPVVNIGTRQKGRIRAQNIIDSGNTVGEIQDGIAKALSEEFRTSLADMENPHDKYKDGKTSFRIKQKLKMIELSERLFQKEFRDLAWGVSCGPNTHG